MCNSWTISSKELGPNVKVFCVSICVSNFIVYLFSVDNPRGSSCLEISTGIAPIIILERFIELISDVKDRLKCDHCLVIFLFLIDASNYLFTFSMSNI